MLGFKFVSRSLSGRIRERSAPEAAVAQKEEGRAIKGEREILAENGEQGEHLFRRISDEPRGQGKVLKGGRLSPTGPFHIYIKEHV